MANIKSQKKRNRQNEKRRARNKSLKSDLNTAIRKVETAAAAGEPTELWMENPRGGLARVG